MNRQNSLNLPGIRSHCHQCNKQTGTKLLFMKAGIGNSCADCGALRRLPDAKPYLSNSDYEKLKRDLCAKGGNDGKARV